MSAPVLSEEDHIAVASVLSVAVEDEFHRWLDGNSAPDSVDKRLRAYQAFTGRPHRNAAFIESEMDRRPASGGKAAQS